jgi:hypothetical protein
MDANGKMIPVETVSGIGEGGIGKNSNIMYLIYSKNILYMPQCTLTQHNHKKRNMNLNNSK